MSSKNTGHYEQKHGPNAVVDPAVRDALLNRAVKGELSCAVAFDVARELGVPPDVIGRASDLLELHLVKCQLGLFGYRPHKKITKPAQTVEPELKQAILTGLLNDRLPCKVAWDIADTLGIRKMGVSAACEALGIKIKPCQLGAF